LQRQSFGYLPVACNFFYTAVVGHATLRAAIVSPSRRVSSPADLMGPARYLLAICHAPDQKPLDTANSILSPAISFQRAPLPHQPRDHACAYHVLAESALHVPRLFLFSPSARRCLFFSSLHKLKLPHYSLCILPFIEHAEGKMEVRLDQHQASAYPLFFLAREARCYVPSRGWSEGKYIRRYISRRT